MIKDEVISTDLAYVWSSISDEPGFKLHCHAEYEIYYFMEGDIEYRIEGRPYSLTPGSLLLIPPKSIHGLTIKSPAIYRRASIHFLPDLLGKGEQALLRDLFDTSGRYYPDPAPLPMEFLIRSLVNSKNMAYPLLRASMNHQIAALLFQIYQLQLQEKAPVPRDERIRAIQRYLDDNLEKNISLADLTGKFHLSKNHLNVVFRREMGTTVNQYIRLKRLVWARQEIHQGSSAEDAAYRVGFNDYSNFYRAYRFLFGMNPSARPKDNWAGAGAGEQRLFYQ